MRLIEDQSSSAVLNGALISLAESFGVDRAHAQDVVGAVFSYCKARHGSTDLSNQYLAFLIARSASSCQGAQISPETFDSVGLMDIPGEQMLLRALAASSDPAALYEAHRRKLISIAATNLSKSGRVIQVNLKKISARSDENIPFVWLSVFKRIAEWICEWRAGNRELDSVVVNPGAGEAAIDSEQRDLLETVLRRLELRMPLAPATLLWAD